MGAKKTLHCWVFDDIKS